VSGETEANISGWTVDTLRSHIEKQFDLRDRAIDAALVAAEKRLDGMNEFRQTLSDQAATFMPRREAEQRLATLERAVAASAGRSSGLDASWGYIIGGLGIFVAVAAIAVGAFT
jgi:hypothetical protein